MKTAEFLTYQFGPAKGVPNNPKLPVLVYKGAAPDNIRSADELAAWFEHTWPKHGWRPAWRYGIYNFPHFHSNAHEILGVFRGHASLRLGHTTGETVVVDTGDVIVLPAGTGHENLDSSPDFQVVGGYPNGQDADLVHASEYDPGPVSHRIARVPLPESDPLFGDDGPLASAWGLDSR